MKLREKFRRFWTMDVHNHEGFTLVELIIVIAILAILSGVAVVGYSSYVKKANLQADMTMIAEIINALTLASYSGDVTENGYIILSADGVKNAAAIAETSLGKVLADAYGSNWATTLKLKHTEWTDDGVLYAALTQENIGAINGSNFLKGTSTSELLQNVQGLTSSAFEFFGNRTDENIFERLDQYSPEFVEYCKDAGLELNEDGTAFDDASDEQLSNLMVLYAADSMSNLTAEDYEAVLMYMTTPTDEENEIYPEAPEGMDTVTLLAAQYTLLMAISASDPNGAEKMESINTVLSGAQNLGMVEGALNSYFGGSDGVIDVNDTDELESLDALLGGYAENFEGDVEGIIAAMGAASEAADSLYTDVKDLDVAGLYSSTEIGKAVDTIMSVAALSDADRAVLLAAVNNLADGEILIFLDAARIKMIVSPANANPKN